MRIVYDPKLDEMLDNITREGGDTSVIQSIIQLYKTLNSGQLDSTNVNFADSYAQKKWREVGSTGQPAFENSWVNFGSGYNTMAFTKDSMGFVHFKGTVKSGTNVSTIFTLPTGYRPIAIVGMVVDAAGAFNRVDIHTDGIVHLAYNGNSSAVLDGVTFKAEQ